MDATLPPWKVNARRMGPGQGRVLSHLLLYTLLVSGIVMGSFFWGKRANAEVLIGPPPANIVPKAAKESEQELLKKIRELSRHDLTFISGSDILTSRDIDILHQDAEILHRYSQVEILLIGHTDERGNTPFNLQLGMLRGHSAKIYLESLGIAPDRIHIVSFGKRAIPGRLLCADHRERCWRRHRIVHMVGYLPNESVTFQGPSMPVQPPPPSALPPKVVVFQGKKQDQGIYLLLPPGKVEVENVLMYLHNSSTQAASQNFSIFPLISPSTGTSIERVDDDYYIEMISVFVGITHKLELEGDIPYVYRTQTQVSSPLSTSGVPGTSTLINQSGNNLGDIEYGLHYQFNSTPWLKGIYMGNVMVKSITGTNPFSIPISSSTGFLSYLPTGTGFWSIEPGFSFYFPITPIVFYANMNYIYNFARNFGGSVGAINPGNATDFNFGGWFSFNQKTLFTIGYDQMTIWPPTENGVQIPLTRILQMGSVLFGGSYYVTPRFFYMINVAAGITPDAPNVAVTIRFPLFN